MKLHSYKCRRCGHQSAPTPWRHLMEWWHTEHNLKHMQEDWEEWGTRMKPLIKKHAPTGHWYGHCCCGWYTIRKEWGTSVNDAVAHARGHARWQA